jgi:conjugal transfer/entry exclusion protein
MEYYRDYEKATITNDTNSELQDEHNSLRGTKLITEQIIKNINDRITHI